MVSGFTAERLAAKERKETQKFYANLASEIFWTKNFGGSKVVNIEGKLIMENEDPKIFETTFACFGIHVGLSMLLTVCLTVYDGLQHTLSFLMLYMEFGWIIPFALWFKVRDLLRRPASPKRLAINKLTPAITLMVLGPIFFCGNFFAAG
jgi:hypothetical protein